MIQHFRLPGSKGLPELTVALALIPGELGRISWCCEVQVLVAQLLYTSLMLEAVVTMVGLIFNL